MKNTFFTAIAMFLIGYSYGALFALLMDIMKDHFPKSFPWMAIPIALVWGYSINPVVNKVSKFLLEDLR